MCWPYDLCMTIGNSGVLLKPQTCGRTRIKIIELCINNCHMSLSRLNQIPSQNVTHTFTLKTMEKPPKKTLSQTTYNETIAKAISRYDVYWEKRAK